MANLVIWLLMPILFGAMAVFAFLFGGWIILRVLRMLQNIFAGV